MKLYRKLLLHLIKKEFKKDDIRQNEHFFGDIIKELCQIEWNIYSEDNVHQIINLIFYAIFKSIEFNYIDIDDSPKKIKIHDLDIDYLISNITRELIVNYTSKGEIKYTDLDRYKLEEAKFYLLK